MAGDVFGVRLINRDKTGLMQMWPHFTVSLEVFMHLRFYNWQYNIYKRQADTNPDFHKI